MWRRRRSSPASMVLGFGLFLLVLIFGSLPYEWRSWYRLRQPGTVTTATVVDRQRIRRSRSTSYTVIYRYQTDRGPLTVTDEQVPKYVYDGALPGSEVRLQYEANDPTAIALVHPPKLWVFLLTLLLVLLVLGVIWWFIQLQLAGLRIKP